MTRKPRTTPEKEIDPRVQEQRMEIFGVLLIGLSLLSTFSLVFTGTGVFGLVIREAVFAIFGRGGAVIPSLFMLVGGWHLLRWRKGPALTHRLFGFCILGFWSLVVLHLFSGAELKPDFTFSSSAG